MHPIDYLLGAVACKFIKDHEEEITELLEIAIDLVDKGTTLIDKFDENQKELENGW